MLGCWVVVFHGTSKKSPGLAGQGFIKIRDGRALVSPGAFAAAHGVAGPQCPQGRPSPAAGSLNTGAPQLPQCLMGGCWPGVGGVLMPCSRKRKARRAGWLRKKISVKSASSAYLESASS